MNFPGLRRRYILWNGAVRSRLYAFSTIVDKVPRGGLLKDSFKSTYGTSIDCVISHVYNFPKKEIPCQVVVLTDGYVGEPSEMNLEMLNEKRSFFHFGFMGLTLSVIG